MPMMGIWNWDEGLGPLSGGNPGGVTDTPDGSIVTGALPLIRLSVELGLVYAGVVECGDAL